MVNDLGGTGDGVGADATPAQEVVAEIEAIGGEAIANGDDVADWEGSQRLVNAAIEHVRRPARAGQQRRASCATG